MASFPSNMTCQACGQVHHYRPVATGQVATCRRCNAVLYCNRPRMMETVLALTIAGLVLFSISNFWPLLGLSIQGMEQELHLFGASIAFWNQDYPIVAFLLVLNLVIFPWFCGMERKGSVGLTPGLVSPDVLGSARSQRAEIRHWRPVVP